MVWSQTPSNQDEERRAEVGLRLAGALTWFAFNGNHIHEVRSWLVTALQRTNVPTSAQAKARWGAGLTAIVQGDYRIARIELEGSVTLWRTIGDQRQLALALRELNLVAYAQGDFIAAQDYGQKCVALFRMLGSNRGLVLALENLGSTLAAQGDQEGARALFEEQRALSHSLDFASGISGAIAGLGWISSQQGNYVTARAYFEKALEIRRALAENWMIAEALDLLGKSFSANESLRCGNLLPSKRLTVGPLSRRQRGNGADLLSSGNACPSPKPASAGSKFVGGRDDVAQCLSGGVVYHTSTAHASWDDTIAAGAGQC